MESSVLDWERLKLDFGFSFAFFRGISSFSYASLFLQQNGNRDFYLFFSLEVANERPTHWKEVFCFTVSKRSVMTQIGENSTPFVPSSYAVPRLQTSSAFLLVLYQADIHDGHWLEGKDFHPADQVLTCKITETTLASFLFIFEGNSCIIGLCRPVT